MRHFLLIAISFFLCAPCFAGFSLDDSGTCSAQFLKMPAGAAASAMGETMISVDRDANAIFYNPAYLCSVNGTQLSMSHSIWVGDTFVENMAFHVPSKAGSFGAGLTYLRVPSFKEYDDTGNEIPGSSLNVWDSAILVSYANRIGRFSCGLTFKYIASELAGMFASAYAMDAGIRMDAGRSFVLGASVRNIGAPLRYYREDSPLPLLLKAGAAYKRKNIVFAVDADAAYDDQPYIASGMEYSLRYEKFTFSPRAGYRYALIDQSKTLFGLSAGMGVVFRDYSINYSWIPAQDLGSEHSISIAMRFGNTPGAQKILKGKKPWIKPKKINPYL